MIPLGDLINALLFPTDELLDAFSTVFLLLTLISATAAWTFSVTYGRFYPWRTNRSGRATFYLVTSLAVVLTVAALARWLGDYPGRILLTLAVYTAIPITIIRMLVTLLRGWTHDKEGGPERRIRVGREFDRSLPKRKVPKTMTTTETTAVISSPGTKYATALLSLTVLLVTSLTAALAGPITPTALIQLGLLFLGGVVTYVVPLLSGGWVGGLKVSIGVLAGVLAAVVPLLTGQPWTLQNTLIVLLAGVNALATQLGVAIRKDPIDAGTAVPGAPNVVTYAIAPPVAAVGGHLDQSTVDAAIKAVNEKGGVV
jgi:hypothetical protein